MYSDFMSKIGQGTLHYQILDRSSEFLYSAVYEYNTKSKDDFHVPNCSTTTFKKSVINMGIKLYNRLPLEL
jgi:hypothetical protein